MGVAAVVAARVLRLEKRSLRHIVRAVSVYGRERERERVKLRSQVTPFLLLWWDWRSFRLAAVKEELE